jgi:hypothetical protein
VLGKYESGYKPTRKGEKMLKGIEALLGESIEKDHKVYYLVQVDIDNPDHYQYFQDLETFTVKSGRGYHLYLVSEDPIHTKNPYPIDGIEVRGIGGLSVIPPSIHPETGKPYRVYKDSPILEVKNVYQTVYDRIPPELNPKHPNTLERTHTPPGKKRKGKKHPSPGKDRVFSSKIVNKIVKVLDGVYTPAESNGMGRNELVFCLAGWLRKSGVTLETALEVVGALGETYEDEEMDSRLIVTKRTYEQDLLYDVEVEDGRVTWKEGIRGSFGLREVLKAKDPEGWEDRYLMLELILEGSKPWQREGDVNRVTQRWKE